VTRSLLVLALCALACDRMAGDHDGYCDYEKTASGQVITHQVGDYRCAGSDVEICEPGQDPNKDRPEWYVIKECDIPDAAGRTGGCALNPATGVASCVYAP